MQPLPLTQAVLGAVIGTQEHSLHTDKHQN